MKLQNSGRRILNFLFLFFSTALVYTAIAQYFEDGTSERWLLLLAVGSVLATLIRFLVIETIVVDRDRSSIRVVKGSLFPRTQTFHLERHVRAETRGKLVLFFSEDSELPFARLHTRNEELAAATIGAIDTYLSGGQAATPVIPSSRTTLLAWVMIGLNIAVYGADLYSGHALLEHGYLSREAFFQGEVWRVLTSMFLHANLPHILMNMLAVSSLLSFLEPLIGTRRCLVSYLLSGLVSGLWALLWIGDKPLVGASGAIFGLFGVIAWLGYRGEKNGWDPMLLPSQNLIMQNLALNFFISLIPNISLAAHFGGFVAGWAYAAFALRARRTPSLPYA